MNIPNTQDPTTISNELRFHHKLLKDKLEKDFPIDVIRIIANTALRFFRIAQSTFSEEDKQKHLEYLIGKLERAILELDEPEMSELAIGDIWYSIHRNTSGNQTFEEIDKYIKN